jgi:antitoxin YefM
MLLLNTNALEVRNASEARKNWSFVLDQVVRDKPLAIKRNRDLAFMISDIHLATILEKYRFQLEYDEEDGIFSGSLDEIDLVADGNSLDELKDKLAYNLLEYAQDYFIHKFHLAPNRLPHLPYVLHVLIQPNLDGVKKLIDAKLERA